LNSSTQFGTVNKEKKEYESSLKMVRQRSYESFSMTSFFHS